MPEKPLFCQHDGSISTMLCYRDTGERHILEEARSGNIEPVGSQVSTYDTQATAKKDGVSSIFRNGWR